MLAMQNINTVEHWNRVYESEIKAGEIRQSMHRYDFLRPWLTGAPKLLDVGCGTGSFFRWLLTEGHDRHKINGVDLSPVAVEQCLKLGVAAHNRDVNALGWTAGIPQYDVVTCLHTLEHVNSAQGLVLDVMSLVKPGGRAIFAIPLNCLHPEHVTVWDVSDVKRLFERYSARYYVPNGDIKIGSKEPEIIVIIEKNKVQP